jgi:hypothetical protein
MSIVIFILIMWFVVLYYYHVYRIRCDRNSSPAIRLRESYRDGAQIKKRTIANLSDWPSELVEGLRTLLKGGIAAPADQQSIIVRRTLPHGHVADQINKTQFDPCSGSRIVF